MKDCKNVETNATRTGTTKRRTVAQAVAGIITTAALTFGVLTAMGARSAVASNNPLNDAQPYASCGAGCFDKYYLCIIKGNDPNYCQDQYMRCQANCGINMMPAN